MLEFNDWTAEPEPEPAKIDNMARGTIPVKKKPKPEVVNEGDLSGHVRHST